MCIGARGEEALEERVRTIMILLEKAGMTINLSKSVLRAATEISCLGYCISQEGIKPDKRLVDKIMAIKVPRCKKELDYFVGLANYFGRYVKNFEELTEPLNYLRRKNVPFAWTAWQQTAFEYLKKALYTYPVVQPFDASKESVLITDASETSISAVLTQEGHPAMYLLRKLTQNERNYSNIEREALAIV